MKKDVISKLAKQMPVSTAKRDVSTRSLDGEATTTARSTGGTSKAKGCGCRRKSK